MSGHSKWATIKRKKGAIDAKRGKLFTKLIKEITVAARMGGSDVTGNPRLRKAVASSRAQAMPNDIIKKAIQRGSGELEGASYEEVLYEGTGPGGTLFLAEGMTDNKNRTVAELRKIFEKNNGVMSAAGSALWAFDRVGMITIAKDGATEDQLMDIAAGAGADDYSLQDEDWLVLSSVPVLETVGKALEDAKIVVKSSNPGFIPKNKKLISGRDAEVCLNLVEALDDHDDVQNVYADFDIPEEELARILG